VLSNRSACSMTITQLFAQVTNPRSMHPRGIVTSLGATSAEGTCCTPAGSCRRFAAQPSSTAMTGQLLYVNEQGETPGFKAFAIDCLFEVGQAGKPVHHAAGRGAGRALKMSVAAFPRRSRGRQPDRLVRRNARSTGPSRPC